MCERLISVWCDCFGGGLWLLSRVLFVVRGLSQLFMGLSRSVQHAVICGMSLVEVEELLGGGMGVEGLEQQKHMRLHRLTNTQLTEG